MKLLTIYLLLTTSACAVVKPIQLAYSPSMGTRSFFGAELVETIEATGLTVLKADYRQRIKGTFQLKLVDSQNSVWSLEANKMNYQRNDLDQAKQAEIGTNLSASKIVGELRPYGRTRGTFVSPLPAATEAHHSARWALRSMLISAIPRLPASEVRRDDMWRSEVDIMGNKLSARGRVVKVRGDRWFIELKTAGRVRWETAPAQWMEGEFTEVTLLQWSGSRGEVLEAKVDQTVDLKDDSSGRYKMERKIQTKALSPEEAMAFLDGV